MNLERMPLQFNSAKKFQPPLSFELSVGDSGATPMQNGLDFGLPPSGVEVGFPVMGPFWLPAGKLDTDRELAISALAIAVGFRITSARAGVRLGLNGTD